MMKPDVRHHAKRDPPDLSSLNTGWAARLSPLLKSFITSRDLESLAGLFGDTVRSLGFSNYAISRLSKAFDRSRVRISTHTICTHYPNNWVQHYQRRDYGSIDPVHRVAFTRSTAYRWGDIAGLTRPERRLLGEAHEVGLVSGLSIPIHEPSGMVLLVSVTGQPVDVDAAVNLRLANVIGTLFHAELDRLGRSCAQRRSLRLSPRQRDCLFWVAQGKTSWEISKILGISRHTVDFHIAAAMKTLHVTSRTTAAVNAAIYGLIQH